MSATLSEDVKALKKMVLHNPVSNREGRREGYKMEKKSIVGLIIVGSGSEWCISSMLYS